MNCAANHSTLPTVAGRNTGFIPVLITNSLVTSILIGICFIVSTSKHTWGQWKAKLLRRSIYPLVNSSAMEYRQEAKGLVTRALKDYGGKPFVVDTGIVHFVIIDPKYATEIRGNPKLDSTTLLQKAYQDKISGFEPYESLGSDLLITLIKSRLSRNIDSVAVALARETQDAYESIVTNNEDWHEVPVRDTLKDLVTRVSLRVFLGPELCRDSEWLRISRLYQTQSMKALKYLRLFPKILRPIVGRFSSECHQLRHVLAQTRQLTDKVLQERQAAKMRGLEVEHDDALTWAEEIAEIKGIRSDAATWQLALSTVALHTSSDLIGQVVLDLCEHPEMLQPLRQEIHDMMSKDGRDATHCEFSKADVQSLRLMDSVLKESQRLKPVSIISMGRWITEEITLQDGTILPKDHAVAVSCHWMWDPDRYEKPELFNGYRFYERQIENDRSAHFVSTSPDHLGFGHGRQACPGRYFAAHLAKVILCHLLHDYDLKKVEEGPVKPVMYGFETNVNPLAKILIRRRTQRM